MPPSSTSWRRGPGHDRGRAPVRKEADVDALGRPALGHDYAIQPYLMIKPLSDPWGGTNQLGGRHPPR